MNVFTGSSGSETFFFLKESNKDMIWTLGFRCVSALVLITEFHPWNWIDRSFAGGCHNGVFQNTHHQIKPRKKISIDGLSELSVLSISGSDGLFWITLYSELFSHRTALLKVAQLEDISRAPTNSRHQHVTHRDLKPANVLVNGITVVRKTANVIVFKVSPIVYKLTAIGKADLNLFKRRWQYILAQATLRRVSSPTWHLMNEININYLFKPPTFIPYIMAIFVAISH